MTQTRSRRRAPAPEAVAEAEQTAPAPEAVAEAEQTAPAPEAVAEGMALVEGVWLEVFTGLSDPDRVKQFEQVALPADVAAALVDAGAVRLVTPAL